MSSESARWPANPFAADAVFSRKWFAGRGAELDQLRKFVRDRVASALVSGPRGIGKSSLVEMLLQQDGVRGIVVDAAEQRAAMDGRHPEASVRALLRVVAEELKYDFLVPPEVDTQTLTDVELRNRVIPAVCEDAGSDRVVIVIDEVDALPDEVRQRLERSVRPRRSRPTDKLPLWIFVEGHSWSARVPRRRPREVRLGPLVEADVRALLERCESNDVFRFEESSLDYLLAETCGYPLLLTAVLEIVYNRRFAAGDRSPVTATDVRRAAEHFARTPPLRVEHALEQAGPAAVRVLYTLAEPDRRAMTERELREVFAREMPGWQDEVASTLQRLRESHLLEREEGAWSHAVPLLRKLVAAMDRAEVIAQEHAPLQEAWQECRRGEEAEAAGDQQAALAAYERAAEFDRNYWLPRWHQARIIAESGLREAVDGGGVEDLTKARHLLDDLVGEIPAVLGTHSQAVALLGRVLVALGELAEPGSGRRRAVIDEFRHRELLNVPGARELVAAEQARAWVEKLSGDDEQTINWPRYTREFLYDENHSGAGQERMWSAMAGELERRLRTLVESQQFDSAIDWIKGTAWILLDEAAPGATPVTTWKLIAQILLDPNTPQWTLLAEAWEVLLLRAPDGGGAKLRDRRILERFLASFLTTGDSHFGEASRLAALAADVDARWGGASPGFWNGLVQTCEGVIKEADRERLEKAAVWMGPVLQALTERAADDDSREYVRELAEDFRCKWVQGLRAAPVAVPSESERAWRKLLSEQAAKVVTTAGISESESAEMDERLRELVEDVLANHYEIDRAVPYRLRNLSAHARRKVLTAFHGTVAGQPASHVLIKSYQIRAPNEVLASLLRTMWDRERRALVELSLSSVGRALPRFQHASFDSERDLAVLVTEWLGERTLRDELDDFRDRLISSDPKARVGFWTHVAALVEALVALHHRTFIHRAISPDVIYIRRPDAAESDAGSGGALRPAWELDARIRPALVLSHFEWSVYLRGLQGLGPDTLRDLNRYVSPEGLRSALGTGRAPAGEAYVSDAYALGLTLFECLIRQLGAQELGFYRTKDSYTETEELEHKRWIDLLRRQVAKAAFLADWEQDLLRSLLQFEISDRPGRLFSVLEELQERLAEIDCFEKPLVVCTTLSGEGYHAQGKDPRNDNLCVAYFLAKKDPNVAASKPEHLSPDRLAAIVSDDLMESRVYFNRQASGRASLASSNESKSRRESLLLESRSGLLYRVSVVSWNEKDYPEIGYLTVARPHEGDAPQGRPIVVLKNGVKVCDIGKEVDEEVRAIEEGRRRTKQAESWTGLFDRAEEARKAVGVEKAENPHKKSDHELEASRSRLLWMLRLSVEADFDAAWRENRYERVSEQPLVVRAPADAEGNPSGNLVSELASLVDNDVMFEVAEEGAPPGSGDRIAVKPDGMDVDQGTVELDARPDQVPPRGVLRAAANEGTLALLRRRRSLLRQLEGDDYLLDTIDDPRCHASATEAGPVDPFLDALDTDKQKILETYASVRPLLVIQGPPGTGKTTLATEIVLQTLGRDANARIMVTTQGHEPLDNLCERLAREQGRLPRAGKVLDRAQVVRVMSGNRLSDDYPKAVQPFLSQRKAQTLFESIVTWVSHSDSKASGLKTDAAKELGMALEPFESAPESLRRRIEQSAAIVFATANAREIEVAQANSFDLVIVEEAARLVPIELLGAMRLARRWLLIGDHYQLPPFGFETVEEAVKTRLSQRVGELQAELEGRPHKTAELALLEQANLDLHHVPRFMRVFETMHETPPRAPEARHADTLRVQWRMEPRLGDLVSEVFYDGEAVTNPTKPDELEALRKRTKHTIEEPHVLKGAHLVWVDFPSALDDPLCSEARGPGGSLANEAERRTTVALLRRLRASRGALDIALLSPYRRQVDDFRALLAAHQNWFEAFGTIHDRVYTVDSFQGREAEVVVLSLVRNNQVPDDSPRAGVGFLADRRRATVMFSRAVKLLVVLGSYQHFERFKVHWITKVFKEHAENKGCVINYRDLLSESELEKLRVRRFG